MIKVTNTNNKIMKKPQVKMNIKIPQGGYTQRDMWIKRETIKEVEKIIEERYTLCRKYNDRNKSAEYFINGLKHELKELGEKQ